MKQLHHIVNIARLRVHLNIVFSRCSHFVLALSCLLVVLAFLDRGGSANFIPWNVVWITSGVLLALVMISFWFTTTVTVLEAAAAVDQKMNLRDRISTAISCEQSDQPFSTAVVEDAIETVQAKNVQFEIAKSFPITPPKKFNAVWVAALLVFIILWTPQWGWWSDTGVAMASDIIASNENIESSIDAVLEQLEKEEILSESLEDELAELSSMTVNDSIDSETLRREALRKITDIQKRLEEMLQDENALAYEEMLRKMQALKMPENSRLQPMVANMKNGNFDQAKKEFDKVEKQLESEELSEEERKQLAKAMEELAKQLEKLSKANDALASALSASGLNSNFANNPDAAMKAIENAKDLTEEQKKKLLELLKAQQKASQTCKKMSEGCKECAGGKQGAGMASELEKLKAMQMFKTKSQMAKSICQNAAKGMCKGGSGNGKGGTGGKGLGNGGNNATKETETTSVAKRSPVQTLEGTIIARQLFEGGLLTSGESTAEVRETVLAQQRDAEQAIVDEEVPRKYHELLRHYFGQLEELTEPLNEDDAESSE